jgi:c-di-GMP-binding flagellar brake protein YcgR
MIFANKRKYIRLHVYHLIKYKKVSDPPDGPFTLTTLRDIGAGGICFKSEEYLPVSTFLVLKLNFPGISTSVSALAKIVWIRQKKSARFYEVGAQFIEIDENIQKMIDDKIKSTCKKFYNKGNILSRLFPARQK